MHDSVISKNGRISVRSHANTTFYLTIHEVQESDRGFYLCQVNTKPMRIQIGYLEVNVTPKVLKLNSTVKASIGSSATLECILESYPRSNILWQKSRNQSKPIIYSDHKYSVFINESTQPFRWIARFVFSNSTVLSCLSSNSLSNWDLKLFLCLSLNRLINRLKILNLEQNDFDKYT
ncbi:hypothetical protein QR98_0077970 [Sarcoptes scabiei]|uniref:Uncharacterized protein n=1 Tax=Sarcoptes scabiei TaxID=52283 RepID=A0A132AE99_SARSC|nr:hypothetical protein QR98_0077970 [Sarcoptes scabiei]